MIFIPKCIKIIFFFYFLKIIFKISASKRFKTYKKIFFNKNNFEVLGNTICTAFPNRVKKRKNIVLPKVFEIKERGV
jgi:ABC-type spermidine/putrescine transport system permease subunit I